MKPVKIIIIEDDPVQSLFWKMGLERRYGERLKVETYSDPREGIERIASDTDLLLVDWLMPHLDGADVIQEAVKRGLSPKKIVVFSVRTAREIHKKFAPEDCLAMIEKGDPLQEKILFRILDEMMTT